VPRGYTPLLAGRGFMPCPRRTAFNSSSAPFLYPEENLKKIDIRDLGIKNAGTSSACFNITELFPD
ncbi:MAG: hypothetical protein WAU81_04765, partial [Candidatus Aminicenantales bacterium]